MHLLTIETKSDKQTRKVAELFAEEIVKTMPDKNALVIGLEGELGSGKTVFVKGFAKGLGIKEVVTSPTFVLLKIFKIPLRESHSRSRFVHVDAYRLENPKELDVLGWKELISDSQNIIVIEWSNNIKRILPEHYFNIKFSIISKNNRGITFYINDKKR